MIENKDWDGFLQQETPERAAKVKAFLLELKTICLRHQTKFLLKMDGTIVNPQDLEDGKLNLIVETLILQQGMYRFILF